MRGELSLEQICDEVLLLCEHVQMLQQQMRCFCIEHDAIGKAARARLAEIAALVRLLEIHLTHAQAAWARDWAHFAKEQARFEAEGATVAGDRAQFQEVRPRFAAERGRSSDEQARADLELSRNGQN